MTNIINKKSLEIYEILLDLLDENKEEELINKLLKELWERKDIYYVDIENVILYIIQEDVKGNLSLQTNWYVILSE